MSRMYLPWAAGARRLLALATAAVAAVVFVIDALTPPDCVVSGLYVVVILLADFYCSPRQLRLIVAACAGLTIVAQVLDHALRPVTDQVTYVGVLDAATCLMTIGLTYYLVMRGRAAAAALLQARSDLFHVNRVTTMGELTASIAHEVNQPIAGVITNAGACLRWLDRDAPDIERARSAAARIVNDGTRAADIIARIRLIFAKGAPQRRWVDLNLLARETLDLTSSEAARQGVAVRTDLPPDIPRVMADPVQLEQVLMNLILNAIDAMKTAPGPRELAVRSARASDGQIVVTVSDTGVGLRADGAERMFDPFFTTKPGGTGMGLSISRSIIEAHQGRLWATPNTPNGAVFQFTLPIDSEAPLREASRAGA